MKSDLIHMFYYLLTRYQPKSISHVLCPTKLECVARMEYVCFNFESRKRLLTELASE